MVSDPDALCGRQPWVRRPISSVVVWTQSAASGPHSSAGYSRAAPVLGSTTARCMDEGEGAGSRMGGRVSGRSAVTTAQLI